MNILFVSHCDFSGNSAMQIFSIANTLADLGAESIVCVPEDTSSVSTLGPPRFQMRSFEEAHHGVLFSNGKGPDFVHAWTPRELVRKLTARLVHLHGCPYLVHLEDNEEVILEVELGRTYAELLKLPLDQLDALVPEYRSHPTRYKEFVAQAAGMTALIDRLLEFKPPHMPHLVFWPGFDDTCLNLPGSDTDLRKKLGIGRDVTVLAYNGNIHKTNAAEVHSLFLAVQALRRCGRRIVLLKTGWNQVSPHWVQESIDSQAVIDLGFVPRSAGLWGVLASADILVQPGRSDRFNDYRFPSKLPEFFASGRPVLLPKSNVGLAVRDGVEAVVLERGDAIDIAEKLELLMDNPALAAQIGTAGKDFAVRRLSWPKNVAALHDFYAFLLGEPSASRTVKS
ncbi:MAG TPA: glycosyltransferase [Bryobacteraceae bacterium]|nr:glycosyltransferase [Bryobacteraceae bacterium]